MIQTRRGSFLLVHHETGMEVARRRKYSRIREIARQYRIRIPDQRWQEIELQDFFCDEKLKSVLRELAMPNRDVPV